MSDKKTKEKRIKAEERRLKNIYKDLKDDKKIIAAQGLIPRAAYMRITLEDYEEDINLNGATEKFSQGDQEPYDRKRPVADLYNTMNTAYQKIIKQLTDILPEEKQKETDAFLDFISGDSNAGTISK